ncbi:MAG: amidohydrolase family protein [Deltaproteobacteria bacterium]|nr:amidohydrolase family protein [Deltaproteobacteria bacterium]
MRDGFKVIDADRHVLEPSDLYARYLPEKFRGRVRIEGPNQTVRSVDGEPVSDSERRPGRVMQDFGYIFSSSKRWRETFADALAARFDPASNLRDMDREGIDVSVLFPTLGLYIMWRDNIDPELSAAICRAYNSWLAEYCSYDKKRLHGVALIPLQDPARALTELRHAKEKLGLVGIFWRPNKLCGRTLSSPDYFPIYEAASELGAVVCVHEGARTVLPQAGADRYSEFGRHVACHPLEQMLACLNLCADGVLEKFPRLKVAHLESGCGWVPFWLERMDEHWEHESHGSARTTKEKPSFYFKRQCWVSCEAGEELAPVVVEHVGADYLVVATDYPHSDAIGKFPELTVGALSANDKLSVQTRRKILWDNPARLYGLGA